MHLVMFNAQMYVNVEGSFEHNGGHFGAEDRAGIIAAAGVLNPSGAPQPVLSHPDDVLSQVANDELIERAERGDDDAVWELLSRLVDEEILMSMAD